MFQPTGAHLDLSNFQLLSVKSFSYNIAFNLVKTSTEYENNRFFGSRKNIQIKGVQIVFLFFN